MRLLILINITIFFLLFIYLINLKTVYFSFPIFYFFAPFGLLLFFNDLIKKKYTIEYGYILFFSLTIIGFLFSCLSILFNQSGDFFLVRQVYLYNIICFFYLYFFVKIFLKNGGSLDDLITLFLATVSVQLIISFTLYLSPTLFNLFFSFFDTAIGFVSKETVENFNDQRMIAIGNPFFGSAILNCFSLIMLAIYFKYTKNKKLLILIWIVISVLGMASARTTIIGIIISLIIFLINFKISFKYLFSVLLVLILAVNFFYFTNDRIQNIIDFSLGFIFDFNNSQASQSTSTLMDMLKIFPDNLNTWIYGDGFFLDNNGYYYKGVDVGYSRIIFANGVLGLMYFILFQILIFVNSSLNFKKNVFPIFFIILVLILNVKGVVNFVPYFLIFLIFSTMLDFQKGLKK